jgi:hypothetical protein
MPTGVKRKANGRREEWSDSGYTHMTVDDTSRP